MLQNIVLGPRAVKKFKTVCLHTVLDLGLPFPLWDVGLQYKIAYAEGQVIGRGNKY